MIGILTLKIEIPDEDLEEHENAEHTISILASRVKEAGYATDLVDQRKRFVPYVKEATLTYVPS